ESGVISADIMPVSFHEIASFAEATFKPISETKNLSFSIAIDPQLPEILETDVQRLNQVLKNLLSNAFKFTEKGGVKMRMYRLGAAIENPIPDSDQVIAFSIEDTGIGISKKTQGIIFEAFQQAEGSTSRKYGGTGLGLSISKGFAELLGGTITVESELGKGSVFTLYIPLQYKEGTKPVGEYSVKQLPVFSNKLSLPAAPQTGIEDDRFNILPNDKVLLIIEDDLRFTQIMMDKAHDFNLKTITAAGYLEVYDFIQNYQPAA